MPPPSLIPPSVPPPAPPPHWSWRRISSALVLVAIIVSVPSFYVFESWRSERAWAAYERDAKQRGVKLTMAEFVPPPVPDAENFASIAILNAAFETSDAGVQSPLKLVDARDPAGGRLKVGDLLKQQRIDLEAWRKHLVEAKFLESTTDQVASDILRGLDHAEEPLSQLRAAGRRPHCRFPVQWEKNLAATLPHLGILQDGARVFALRTGAHLAMGNSAAAYEEFRDGLRLATAIRDEPSLISGLVRVSIATIMLNAVWTGLAEGTWAEPELRRIEADLAALDWLRDYSFSINSDRASYNGALDTLIADPGQFAGVGKSDNQKKAGARFYPSGWFRQSKLRFNRYIDELIARVEPEQRRVFLERPIPSSAGHLQSLPAKIYYMFFVVAAPALETVDAKFVQAASLCDMARLACALERHRLIRGDYPSQLADLAPEFLSSIPVEIINGEPYRYHPAHPGGFVLYSVGRDGQDDGGVIDLKATSTKQKDWVWRAPAQPARDP